MTDREDWFKAAAGGDSAYIAQHLETGKGLLTDRQETATMLAAQAGHEAVVQILLNYEALYVNQDGDTALMLAARQNNATICKLLATRERTILNSANRDACVEAVLAGAYQAFEVLYEQTELSSDHAGMTVLDYSSRIKDLRYLRALLSRSDLPVGCVSNTLALALNEQNLQAAHLLEAYLANPKSMSPSRKASVPAEPASPTRCTLEEDDRASTSPHMHAMPMAFAADTRTGVQIPVTIPSTITPLVVDPPSILTSAPMSAPSDLNYASAYEGLPSNANELRIQLFNRLSLEGLTHISDETISFLEALCDQASKAQQYRDQLEIEMHSFEQDRTALLQQLDDMRLLVSQYADEENARPAVDCSAAYVQAYESKLCNKELNEPRSPITLDVNAKLQRTKEALRLSYRRLNIRKAEAATYKAMKDVAVHSLGPLLDAYGFVSAVSLQPFIKNVREFEKYIETTLASSEKVEEVIPPLIKKGTCCLENLNEVFLSILESIPNASDFLSLDAHRRAAVKPLAIELSVGSSLSSSSQRVISPQTNSPPARLQLSAYNTEKERDMIEKMIVSKITPTSAGLTVTDLHNEQDNSNNMKQSANVGTDLPEKRSISLDTSNLPGSARASTSKRDDEPCIECQSLKIQLAKVRNDHVMIQNEYMILEAKLDETQKASAKELNDLADKLSASNEIIQQLNNDLVALRDISNRDHITIADLRTQLAEKQQELDDAHTNHEISKEKINSLTSRLAALDTTLNAPTSFDANNESFNTRMSEAIKQPGHASKDDFFSLISMNGGSRRESDAAELCIQIESPQAPKHIDSATSPGHMGSPSNTLDSDSALRFATIPRIPDMRQRPHRLNTDVSDATSSQQTHPTDPLRDSEDTINTKTVAMDIQAVLSPQQVVVSRSKSRVPDVVPRVPTASSRKSVKLDSLEQDVSRLTQELQDSREAEKAAIGKLQEIGAFSRRVSLQYGCVPPEMPAPITGAGISGLGESIIRDIVSLEARLNQVSLYSLYDEELRTIYAELKVGGYLPSSAGDLVLEDFARSRGLSKAVSISLKTVSDMKTALENKDRILSEISTGMSDLDAIISSQQKTISEDKVQIEECTKALAAQESLVSSIRTYLQDLGTAIFSIDTIGKQTVDMSEFPKNASEIFTSLTSIVELHSAICKENALTAQEELSKLQNLLDKKEEELLCISQASKKNDEIITALTTEVTALKDSERKATLQEKNMAISLEEALEKIKDLERITSLPQKPDINIEALQFEARQFAEQPYLELIKNVTSSSMFSKAVTPKSLQMFRDASDSDKLPPKLLASILDELSQAVTASGKTLADMRRQLRETTEDLEAAEEEISHKNIRIQTLERELQRATDHIAELESVPPPEPAIDRELYVEKELYLALESKVSGLSKELSASSQLTTQLKSQLSSKEELITSLQTRNSSLLTAKTEIEVTISDQRVQLSDLELQLANSKHDTSHFRTLLEDVKLELTNTKGELETRKKELVSTKRNAEKILAETHETLSHAESRILILTKELRETQAGIEDKEEEIARLHTKLREQRVSLSKQSIDVTAGAGGGDHAEVAKAKQELTLKLEMALDDLSSKTSECNKKTKTIETLETQLAELNNKVALLETNKTDNELRSAQNADEWSKQTDNIIMQCTQLKEFLSSSNAEIHSKFEAVTKKLLYFSIHAQQLVSLHHTFIREQMEHKAEIETLHKQESLLRNLRAQDSGSINMLNTELADAKRYYSAQLEHKDMELNSLRDQLSIKSNEHNELALSFVALKESLQKAESLRLEQQNMISTEVNATEHVAMLSVEIDAAADMTSMKSAEIMQSPNRMINASVEVCNTEELDRLKITIRSLQEEIQALQAVREELVNEKQTLLQQNILYKEEIFTTHTLITNKLEPDNVLPASKQDLSVIALVQRMIAKMKKLEEMSLQPVTNYISPSIDAPAVDVSGSRREKPIGSHQRSEPRASLDTLPIVSNLLATKIVEVIELNRIISVKSDQLEWVADAALKAHLSGTDVRDRAKILQLTKAQNIKVDIGQHQGVILTIRDRILNYILSSLPEKQLESGQVAEELTRFIKTLENELCDTMNTHLRTLAQTKDFGTCAADQHDSANFKGQLTKAIQTASNLHENATLQELHSLKNDFDVLNVSYSNTTAALNEAMLKNQELEREHSDIKIAFLNLQEENKKLLQEQESLHKDIINLRANFKEIHNNNSRSRASEVRDPSLQGSPYKLSLSIPPINGSISHGIDLFIKVFTKGSFNTQELRKMAFEHAEPISDCLKWLKTARSTFDPTLTNSTQRPLNASIVAVTSSILESSIIGPTGATAFNLSPEHMVRDTSLTKSPRLKETPVKLHSSLTTSTQGRKSEVSPRPRFTPSNHASRSQRTKDTV
ncbi:Coiled-coil protein [Giardia lamblia P15]|uniref:Coiled-coil protein n=1 Tax=Giardia intestinalis (strain P15) TaxID=658858 RepID=E1EWW4_GIAIA|nr:Coiled-coil protein [Giardia lamblia P15]